MIRSCSHDDFLGVTSTFFHVHCIKLQIPNCSILYKLHAHATKQNIYTIMFFQQVRYYWAFTLCDDEFLFFIFFIDVMMRFKDHGLCVGISTNSERPPYCFFRYINIQTRLLILDNVDLPLKFHLSRGWLIITTRKQPCYTTGQLKTGTIYLRYLYKKDFVN